MARRTSISRPIALSLISLALCTQAFGAPTTDTPSSDTFVRSGEDASWTSIARCALEPKAPLDCVEQRSKRAVEILLENERRNKAGSRSSETASSEDDGDGDAFGEDVEHLVDQLSEAIADAAGGALERRLRGVVSMRSLSKTKEDSENVIEGRGKKKKKLKKLIHLLKLVILIVLVKLKLAFILLKLQTLFQFKLVIMTAIILALTKLQYWTSLKNKHDPQKVIYYEHAQHQHHYDDSHWHGGHDEQPSSGGSGWNLWGRSYDETTADDPQRRNGPGQQSSPSTVSFPGLPGIQSGIYRAADGTRLVIGQQQQHDAQDMAYSAHKKR